MGRRRSKSPAPRKGARSKKLQAEATTVAKPKATTAAKTKASSSSDVANVALLAVWFGTSIYFNYLTPEFNKYLSAKTDITMVELLSAAAYGVAGRRSGSQKKSSRGGTCEGGVQVYMY